MVKAPRTPPPNLRASGVLAETEDTAFAISDIQRIIDQFSVPAPHQSATTSLADRIIEHGRVQRAIRTIEQS